MDRLRDRVPWAELLTLAALPPFYEALLSPRERARCGGFGARRRRDFAAGRIALKLATRSVTTSDLTAIDTLAEDGVLARSPAGVGGACIAHDRELAIAVASARGVPGVDVELVAPRLEQAAALFAGAAERRLAEAAAVGRLGALGRIWTAKEACAKAWATPLPELFEACELVEIGRDASVARLGGERVEILHFGLGEHLVSLVERAP
jgi:4'-phosphopantetheinyl transferase EntD